VIHYLQIHASGLAPIYAMVAGMTVLVIGLLRKYKHEQNKTLSPRVKNVLYVWCWGMVLIAGFMIGLTTANHVT
jgi:MFS superfamily sulfate permease-like transporter